MGKKIETEADVQAFVQTLRQIAEENALQVGASLGTAQMMLGTHLLSLLITEIAYGHAVLRAAVRDSVALLKMSDDERVTEVLACIEDERELCAATA